VVLLEWRPDKEENPLSANQYLANVCKENGLAVKACDIPLFDITFVIDEAQLLSSGDGSELWSKLIKDQLGCHSGPKLCLFSSYGSTPAMRRGQIWECYMYPRSEEKESAWKRNRESRHAQRSTERSIRTEHENGETAKHG
jgi:hypothetical protein